MVKLVEVFNSETHVFMAMEVFNGRELREELRRQGRLDESTARDLFQQVGPYCFPKRFSGAGVAFLPPIMLFALFIERRW